MGIKPSRLEGSEWGSAMKPDKSIDLRHPLNIDTHEQAIEWLKDSVRENGLCWKKALRVAGQIADEMARKLNCQSTKPKQAREGRITVILALVATRLQESESGIPAAVRLRKNSMGLLNQQTKALEFFQARDGVGENGERVEVVQVVEPHIREISVAAYRLNYLDPLLEPLAYYLMQTKVR
jgi:hypothetical protein